MKVEERRARREETGDRRKDRERVSERRKSERREKRG